MDEFHKFYKCPLELNFLRKMLDDHFDNSIEGSEQTEENKKESPLFFIIESNIPYFIIDSVSNFINILFNYFNFHIENDCIEFFDIQYIRKKLLEDINQNTQKSNKKTFDDMHIENIIKYALFAILYCKFHSVFKNTPQITSLSKTKILFLFIFYKIEEAKSTQTNKKRTKISLDEKMMMAYEHIRMDTMTDIKVIELTKLYFCYTHPNQNIENKTSEEKDEIIKKDDDDDDDDEKKLVKKGGSKCPNTGSKNIFHHCRKKNSTKTRNDIKLKKEENQNKSKKLRKKETQDQHFIIKESKKYYSPPPYLKMVLDEFLSLFKKQNNKKRSS